jgi:hypothetical protein
VKEKEMNGVVSRLGFVCLFSMLVSPFGVAFAGDQSTIGTVDQQVSTQQSFQQTTPGPNVQSPPVVNPSAPQPKNCDPKGQKDAQNCDKGANQQPPSPPKQ